MFLIRVKDRGNMNHLITFLIVMSMNVIWCMHDIGNGDNLSSSYKYYCGIGNEAGSKPLAILKGYLLEIPLQITSVIEKFYFCTT